MSQKVDEQESKLGDSNENIKQGNFEFTKAS